MTDEKRKQCIKDSTEHADLLCFTCPNETYWEDDLYVFFSRKSMAYFFNKEDAIFTAVGSNEALAWLKGYLQRMEETEDV